MPVHDWSRVDAGAFHAFHTAWITHLSEALNGGVLPSGYYALPEQHMGRFIAARFTLQAPAPIEGGGLAVAESQPKVRRKLSASSSTRGRSRTLTIRHVSGNRIVALVEIVSPANKDRRSHVEEFIDKAEIALLHGINLLLVDLFPPGAHDPHGMHGAFWERFDDEPYVPPADEPLTLASYVAGPRPDVYVEPFVAGSPLAEMPLFLNPDRYVNVPLETTYLAAFRGLPAFLRMALA